MVRQSDEMQGETAGVDSFAASELFDRTFKEGIALVEETSAYLDGDGRKDSRELSRGAALAYAGESMRLTTRLMQVASWLLVQRAVRQGEISEEEAASEKYRLGLKEKGEPVAPQYSKELPPRLADLLDRSERLYGRVARMDRRIYETGGAESADGGEVARQLAALQDAFKL